MDHIGTALRRLRLESGISLRDLAQRVGVSSAYISRIEHGMDASPTAERLEAFAEALAVPPEALLEAGQRIGTLMDRQVAQQPMLGPLLLQLAQLDLSDQQIADVGAYLQRHYGRPDLDTPLVDAPRLSPLLRDASMILALSTNDLEDAFDLGWMRLLDAFDDQHVDALEAQRPQQFDADALTLGGGLAVWIGTSPTRQDALSFVRLSQPIATSTDGIEILMLVALAEPAVRRNQMLAHLARLQLRGLCRQTDGISDPQKLRIQIQQLERF